MKLVNRTPFPFVVLPAQIRPGEWSAVFIAKTSYALRPGGTAEPLAEPLTFMGDVYKDDEPANEITYDSDFAPWKPHADVLLLATCHAPGGKTTTACRVEFAVGRWTKSLVIIGQRHWKKSLLLSVASDPEPFKSIPIRWENAYGGEGFGKNPAGRGYEKAYLPNVEPTEDRIASPGDRPDPVGFGPINRTWSQRSGKTGSYRGKYMKERWPHLPDDFDFTYFNAAPEDQQFRKFLKGDEELRFENLHAAHASYKCALPGQRIRGFLSEKTKSGKRFREIPLNLDTMFVDLEKETLSLVWRGSAPVSGEEMSEVEHGMCVAEALKDAPPAPAHYEQYLPPPEPPAPPKPAAPAGKQPPAWVAAAELKIADAKKADAAILEQARADAKAAGIDFDALLKKPPATLDDARAAMAAAKADFAGMGVALPAAFDAQLADLAPGGVVDGLAKQIEAKKLPKVPKPPVTPELLKSKAAAKGGLQGQDLSGAKLPGADLSGLDLTGVNLKGADLTKAKLTKTILKSAQLSEADLTGADLTEANLEKADLTKAKLAGAVLAGAILKLADFSEAAAAKAVFGGAQGGKTVFAKAALEEAVFAKAVLPNSDFSGAILTGAKFPGAVLTKSSLVAAKAGGAEFTGADLTGIDASEGGDFKKALFQKLVAPQSGWDGSALDGADFTGAVLMRASFVGCSLKQAKLGGVDGKKATFQKAQMLLAVASDSDFMEAVFAKTDLSGVDFTGANLFAAEFLDAKLEGVKLDGAVVAMSKLA